MKFEQNIPEYTYNTYKKLNLHSFSGSLYHVPRKYYEYNQNMILHRIDTYLLYKQLDWDIKLNKIPKKEKK